MKARKLHFLSIDAMPWSMLQQFLRRGSLPNFSRLEKEGASAQGMVAPGPDATTPPAHAALLCGCPAQDHGIYSYEEPVIENGVIHPWKKRSGFDAWRLQAEPLWVGFLRAGRKTALLHFPLSSPVEAYTTGQKFGADFSDRLVVLESFSRRLTPEIVRKDVDSDGSFNLRLSDSSKIPLPLRAPKAPEPAVFKEKAGGLWRLRFSSGSASEPDIHFLTAFSSVAGNRPDLAAEYLENVGPFVASGATYSYGTDKLGPRVYKGGSGLAEERLLQSLELLADHYQKAVRFVIGKIQPEAAFCYFNGLDLCLHLWRAYLDPSSAAYRPRIFKTLFPAVERMFSAADALVGYLLEISGPQDLLVVVSDHGMAPIESIFYPNQVLVDAGYAVWDFKDEAPVLAQSRAVYNESNSGYIILNLESRGGVVPDSQAGRLTAEIAALFEPFLGSALDKIAFPSQDPEIPNLGEIYLFPKFKVTLQEEVEGKLIDREFVGGQHHYWCGCEEMKAVLYFWGAGVPAGRNLGLRSHLEVAPTIAELCGVPRPNKAGREPIGF